ncbi:DUF5107 domain-containing protein [Lacticaseibacillus parakribbianus]|uniref:DUF5107 domain-containing protein n=1 Tax=Lacticaseibacillus parakribbianus TaxID=2970927 RepID=UPI0021CAE9D9|nr:DUF5107 domain-containing protein [Lacticaseibacillus parakribbianus]
MQVKAWEENVVLPTYEVAKPDKNPLFLEKRVYQGSSGKVYPLPVTEKIADKPTDKTYRAVYLENDYLKVMILPELGGRIQRALDKTNGYDFIYFNHVIKPALVGLVGPWISGGIEFNWPQHHRPSTFMPVEHELVPNADGSQTVIVSEIDQMYGTKGEARFTLYPDKAYIQIDGQLYNRTDLPQTFLWWANPAVPVNDHTYSVFPPDVNAVMDHGKRAVSSFPIATGTYYKYDYSDGVDISRYKNVKVPTSYMAYHSDYNFMGNYDEKVAAGLLHVADHHVSPGKKQWTWGSGDFGQAWDRNLTDHDGPYIELMTGVFTDNQPDFSWLAPYEEKTFTQYFMPYKGVGHIKNATKDAAINVELTDGKTRVAVYASSKLSAQLTLALDDEVLFTDHVALTPNAAYEKLLDTPIAAIDERVKLTLSDDHGVIVAYQGAPAAIADLPDPAAAIGEPTAIKTTEELFLAAQHIEQYRHATLDAAAYYQEGLRRDASDIRLNNGYGLYLYRRAEFKAAKAHFARAVARQELHTPNPDTGAPRFNLGLAQLALGEDAAAFDSFYKATWNDDTKGPAFFQLALAAARQGNDRQALAFVTQALTRNTHHLKARVLQVVLMRRLGQPVDAAIAANLAIDPLDLGSLYEAGRGDVAAQATWQQAMRQSLNNYLELADDYWQMGELTAAAAILQAAPAGPMPHYYLAALALAQGDPRQAAAELAAAEAADPTYCFPNKLREYRVLTTLIAAFPDDTPHASYYLGNLLYDKRRHEAAIAAWEKAQEQLPDFPTLLRNLAFARYNVQDDLKGALALQAKAQALDPTDARLLLELNSLQQLAGQPVATRLAGLEGKLDLVHQRDDLLVEYITLLNASGRYQDALAEIMHRQFHPWEGGEGKVSTQYVTALTELAKAALATAPQKAIVLLNRSLERPANLGEGKLANYHDNLSEYLLGVAYDKLNDPEAAREHFEKATIGDQEPGDVLYYNDQPADLILYMGLAYLRLGETKAAKRCFYALTTYGQKHLHDVAHYDYFAVSMPQTTVFKADITKNHRIYCRYLLALGHYGLGQHDLARQLATAVLAAVPDHLGAITLLQRLADPLFETL